jgi:hypothetical protein
MKMLVMENVARVGEAIDKFPWEDRTAYGNWLAQTYYYVRHSTRLLAAASSRFGFDEIGDALHHRFATHIREEKKHERLALHDLSALALDIATFPELPSTRAFWEPQYCKVEHECPSALFGYILVLETISVTHGPTVRRRVAEAHGEKCTSFVRLHAEEDVDHLEKGYAAAAQLPPPQLAAVHVNVLQTAVGYTRLLEEITLSRSTERAPR